MKSETFEDAFNHRVSLLEKRFTRAQKEMWFLKETAKRTGVKVKPQKVAPKIEQLTFFGT